MIRKLAVFSICLLIFSCARGYHAERRNPASPEELKLTDQIQVLADETEGLVRQAPPDLSPTLAGFAENAGRFKNNALRFGPRSLEARDALDKVRFHASQLDRIMTPENYPKLMGMWQKIRADIDSIAKQLGYKIS